MGLFLVSVKEKTLDGILFILVAFATGTILASALFDLIPESIHHLEELIDEGFAIAESYVFGFILLGYVAFFILERFIYWFHGHAHQKENEYVCYDNLTEGVSDNVKERGKVRNFVLLNLIGDGLHNFLDGVIIMVAFLTGYVNGLVVSLAVLFHELPQEVGDFGILLYGGFTKKKALGFNFLSAMIAMLGGLFAFILVESLEIFKFFFLAFSGGGFLYLASTELMPELLKQKKLKKSIIQSLVFICGILLIISLVLFLPHE
jgi:zinc and cadmium transporter